MARNTDEFYRCEIEGMLFTASMSADGPYISRQIHPGYWNGVALGPASIRYFDESSPHTFNRTENGWWVIKYSSECRIDLNGLSEEGLRELSNNFGIPMWPTSTHGAETFAKSAAFQGLCNWARLHPRLAKRSRTCQEYIPWVEMLSLHKEGDQRAI